MFILLAYIICNVTSYTSSAALYTGICGNNCYFVVNLKLTFETLWIGLGKEKDFHLIVQVCLVLTSD